MKLTINCSQTFVDEPNDTLNDSSASQRFLQTSQSVGGTLQKSFPAGGVLTKVGEAGQPRGTKFKAMFIYLFPSNFTFTTPLFHFRQSIEPLKSLDKLSKLLTVCFSLLAAC